MESILIILFSALALSTILNIVLKRFGISHIIGYILTGTLISNFFSFGDPSQLHSLELIAEFGIVFLMFTIGLEMPIAKLKRMREVLFIDGLSQVGLSALVIFLVANFLFELGVTQSLIIALAFSLSSTAIVLTYLKASKDIHTPYGERSTGILIFQDLAVIPILLLISFLSAESLSMSEVLIKTFISALLIVLFMFTVGKKLMTWLLKFSSQTRLEELFLGSVLSIVIGASLLAHEAGFTYSLGAFIAGMIIAETNFHVKVEADIASYKDLLLGTFFFSVGTKIDFEFLLSHLHHVLVLFIVVLFAKAAIIYLIIRRKLNQSDSIKSALALCQVGEFSFALFALASKESLLSAELTNFLILITVCSMIITPFIVSNIYKLASIFVTEFYESDKITPINKKAHTIVCGYDALARIVCKELDEKGVDFIIISDDLRHVLSARKKGYLAYFGHLEKRSVLESLKVEEASNVIITLSNVNKKVLICEAIKNYAKEVRLVVKIDAASEKNAMHELKIDEYVHAQKEVAHFLVEASIKKS